MIVRVGTARRRGAIALEAAIVMNVLFFLLLGVIVLGMGVFRYQQMVHLAHEGADGPRSTAPDMLRTRATPRQRRPTSIPT